jgi:tetratricopeptide (TPR) repeat protein
LHTERGYFALAIEHLDAGLAIAMQPSMGYRIGQGECLISKAKALIDLDENQKAVGLARTAARIGSDISNVALVCDGNYVEALALLCDDELERAQSAIDAACRTIRNPVQNKVFHSVFALQGVIAIRRRDYSGAAEAFGQAQARARTAINANKRDYLAWDSRGLAAAGYVLLAPHLPEELRQAAGFYQMARRYCSERGAIAHAMRLLGQLPDPKDVLADVRRAASEPYRRNASGSR